MHARAVVEEPSPLLTSIFFLSLKVTSHHCIKNIALPQIVKQNLDRALLPFFPIFLVLKPVGRSRRVGAFYR